MYVKIELIIGYLFYILNSARHPMFDARLGKRSECLHIFTCSFSYGDLSHDNRCSISLGYLFCFIPKAPHISELYVSIGLITASNNFMFIFGVIWQLCRSVRSCGKVCFIGFLC